MESPSFPRRSKGLQIQNDECQSDGEKSQMESTTFHRKSESLQTQNDEDQSGGGERSQIESTPFPRRPKRLRTQKDEHKPDDEEKCWIESASSPRRSKRLQIRNSKNPFSDERSWDELNGILLQLCDINDHDVPPFWTIQELRTLLEQVHDNQDFQCDYNEKLYNTNEDVKRQLISTNIELEEAREKLRVTTDELIAANLKLAETRAHLALAKSDRDELRDEMSLMKHRYEPPLVIRLTNTLEERVVQQKLEMKFSNSIRDKKSRIFLSDSRSRFILANLIIPRPLVPAGYNSSDVKIICKMMSSISNSPPDKLQSLVEAQLIAMHNDMSWITDGIDGPYRMKAIQTYYEFLIQEVKLFGLSRALLLMAISNIAALSIPERIASDGLVSQLRDQLQKSIKAGETIESWTALERVGYAVFRTLVESWPVEYQQGSERLIATAKNRIQELGEKREFTNVLWCCKELLGLGSTSWFQIKGRDSTNSLIAIRDSPTNGLSEIVFLGTEGRVVMSNAGLEILKPIRTPIADNARVRVRISGIHGNWLIQEKWFLVAPGDDAEGCLRQWYPKAF